MSTFDTFVKLHQGSTPLLLGNIWDVHSAKIFEANGFKAIGTSSHAVARSFGFEDGEKLPFEILLRLAKRVGEVVKIPFTVDVEGGYSRKTDDIINNIEKLHDVGVVGVNLEDTIAATTRELQPVEEFQKILSAVVEHLNRKNLKIFLNIRTDGFLLGMPTALSETLTRLKNYERSGANGIFVPGITNSSDIQQVVSATTLPVNVMCMPALPDFEELKSAGVKRISMGPFVKNVIDKKMEELVSTVLEENSFACLFK